jgi:hypothetical protein
MIPSWMGESLAAVDPPEVLEVLELLAPDEDELEHALMASVSTAARTAASVLMEQNL